MKEFQKLSETEMEIMKIIWSKDEAITSGELLEIFNNKDKEWKTQTISTFLTRLVNKGLLTMERSERSNYYRARINFEEYKQNEAESILNKLYKGSIRNFLSALYGNKKVSKEDIDDLKDWFSKK